MKNGEITFPDNPIEVVFREEDSILMASALAPRLTPVFDQGAWALS